MYDYGTVDRLSHHDQVLAHHDQAIQKLQQQLAQHQQQLASLQAYVAHSSPLKRLFAVYNTHNRKHINILGLQFSFKKKKK
jgi:uncharacterized coiled-coil protein SlyX